VRFFLIALLFVLFKKRARHRHPKLYALDVTLPDLKSPNKTKLLEIMKWHVPAGAELIGTYEKKR
jgi:phosphatidylethanolamine-binding protein (PEBP) family uncharacterized protein